MSFFPYNSAFWHYGFVRLGILHTLYRDLPKAITQIWLGIALVFRRSLCTKSSENIEWTSLCKLFNSVVPCSTTFSLQHKNSHTHSLSITAEECKNSIVIQTFCINHRNFREFVYFKTISFLVLHCCSIPIEPVYSFSYGHLRQR